MTKIRVRPETTESVYAKKRYTRKQTSGKRRQKSFTLPDQALTVKEIITKFRKNIPAVGKVFTAMYFDQKEIDYEQLARMEFDDKFRLAQQLRAEAREIEAELDAKEKEREELATKERDEKAKAQQASGAQPGIGSLDNTMPGDTRLNTK